MRLIDADALDEEVMHLFITITGAPKQSTVVNECKKSFREMIDEQPTIDVPGTNAGKHTNADRIRSMTDEELGAFLRKVEANYQWLYPEFPDLDDDWSEWMQSEVEDKRDD